MIIWINNKGVKAMKNLFYKYMVLVSVILAWFIKLRIEKQG